MKVLYTAFAAEALYQAARAAMPDGVELVTLASESDEARAKAMADCEIAIMAIGRLSPAVMDAARRLKLVLHQGVGYEDTLDLGWMRRAGIRLAINLEGTVSVAEHTILLMLAACRRLPFADAALREGRFLVHQLRPELRELRGKRIGYLGMGRIGQEVAARAAAFGTDGVYFDPAATLPPAEAARLGLERAASRDAVLAEADIVTLHLPLTLATHHVIDRAAIARMRPGAILINAARGGLVDEAALADALEQGHLLAAGLDTFEAEPYPAGGRLAALPNVVLTPHIAGGTLDAFRDKMAAIGANVARYRAGLPLLNEVAL
ncbi:MAG TPA: NAD(P)-dependent oxidoreductase [Hyphomicrobiales bacterium]|nr:NAD(P)-dependent oxidoreductase [Hyphomicrobiales bacterium]